MSSPRVSHISDLQLRIAFASLRGMTATLAAELLRLCGSEREFFEMSETQLRYLTQSRARIYSADYRAKMLARAEAEADFVERNSIKPLYFTDADWPRRLAECDDAPPMLFALGQLDLNCGHVVGIVGTRHATPYGIEFTRSLVTGLAERLDSPVIVSGLAYGIDIAAHRAAMRAALPTAAVMATGLNSIYPADHRRDAQEIACSGGMLLTEFGHLEPVHKGNFVARNRIVAGLCDCLVVAESAERGGALITANLAAGYNRDVFALPGRVTDACSAGCNRLIAAGVAALVRDADDLCRAMNWTMRADRAPAPELPMPLNSDETLIVNYLEQNDDASLAALTAATGFAVSKLMSMLIDMEFRGLLLALPGGRYRKI